MYLWCHSKDGGVTIQPNKKKRYRRYFTDAEAGRVNVTHVGTHEVNVGLTAPERESFWETRNTTPSARGGSNERYVQVEAVVGHKRTVVKGRYWDRFRKKKNWDTRRLTESRLRAIDKKTARELYGDEPIPPDAIVVVTKNPRQGVDYEYEVVLPDDSRYASLDLPGDVREIYD